MTINELLEKLKKYDNLDKEIYIERDFDIDDVNIGSGNTISIESRSLYSYIADLQDELEVTKKEYYALERDYDELECEFEAPDNEK